MVQVKSCWPPGSCGLPVHQTIVIIPTTSAHATHLHVLCPKAEPAASATAGMIALLHNTQASRCRLAGQDRTGQAAGVPETPATHPRYQSHGARLPHHTKPRMPHHALTHMGPPTWSKHLHPRSAAPCTPWGGTGCQQPATLPHYIMLTAVLLGGPGAGAGAAAALEAGQHAGAVLKRPVAVQAVKDGGEGPRPRHEGAAQKVQHQLQAGHDAHVV